MSRKSGRMEPERPSDPVLVIEDNSEVRQALVALLEAEGYHVAEAVDGVSALRLLRAGEVRPCLIVLDLMMPRMSGWDFRMEQSRDRRFAAIPVVVVSADPLASQAERMGAAAGRGAPAGYASETRRDALGELPTAESGSAMSSRDARSALTPISASRTPAWTMTAAAKT